MPNRRLKISRHEMLLWGVICVIAIVIVLVVAKQVGGLG